VIRALPVTDEGRLDLDALGEFVTDRTRVIALSHLSNVTGAVTDVGRVVGPPAPSPTPTAAGRSS
jgi:cysteine desulfurase/selenocysteine lyase